MSKDTVLAIRDTEKQAAEIRAEADVQARELIAGAQAAGNAALAEAEAESMKAANLKISAANAQADEVLKKAKESGELEGNAQCRTAKLHMKRATKLILRGIVEKCQ